MAPVSISMGESFDGIVHGIVDQVRYYARRIYSDRIDSGQVGLNMQDQPFIDLGSGNPEAASAGTDPGARDSLQLGGMPVQAGDFDQVIGHGEQVSTGVLNRIYGRPGLVGKS